MPRQPSPQSEKIRWYRGWYQGYLKILTYNSITSWIIERRRVIKNIKAEVPKMVSRSKNDGLSTYVWNTKWIQQLQICRQTVANYWCQIGQLFFDQNTCFLKNVLVSKQKISCLLSFDQIAYIWIYHENIEGKFP